MTIEIKNIANGAIGKQRGGKPVGAAGSDTASGGSAKASAPSDRVSLTASATRLSALEERISNLPVVDTGRVMETRHALATGTHRIDPESTAGNLLAIERAFAQS